MMGLSLGLVCFRVPLRFWISLMTKICITQQTFALTCSWIPICNHSSPDCCPDIVMSSQKTSFLRKIHQIMAKAKPFLQHFTSCTIWLGPKATGGGFNDRADVQRTCRGMLGGWAKKKHSSSLWPGKAAQGQLWSGGQDEGARHMSTTKGRWPEWNFVGGKHRSAMPCNFHIFVPWCVAIHMNIQLLDLFCPLTSSLKYTRLIV